MTQSIVDNWLESIIQNRVSNSIQLNRLPDKKYTLSCQGSEGVIYISRCEVDGFADPKEPGLSWWPAETEGFATPFNRPIPLPGLSHIGSEPIISVEGKDHFIRYPLLNAMFWALTRQEETVVGQNLDRHQRFPASQSHAFQNNYLDRPYVDEHLSILRQVVSRRWPALSLSKPKFSVQLSHDVDRPSRYRWCSNIKLLGRMSKDISSLGFGWKSLVAPLIKYGGNGRLHPLDPYNQFSWMMDVSEKWNLKSTFFFLAGRTCDRLDGDYEIEAPEIQSLMQEIARRGHEIGLHPSYHTYRSIDKIAIEKNRLERACKSLGIEQDRFGSRMHYLRWDTLETTSALSAAGLTYDATLGFADHPGFRCGTCFEYPAFDLKNWQVSPIKVRPLVAMECSVTSKAYLNLGLSDAAAQEFKELILRCATVGGEFSLLWHNSELATQQQRSFYQSIVDFAGERIGH